MRTQYRWILIVPVIALLLAACSSTDAVTKGGAGYDEPAVVETVEGISRVVLTERAAERLGIQTAPVSDTEVASPDSETALRKAVPYSAVMYHTDGETFVYTNPEPLIFVQALVSVDYIEGDLAVLLEGPPAGTAVVTVGADELYATETGVGK